MASVRVTGIPKCLASPFPEPRGKIPIGVSEFKSPRATSITVPSPPTATTYQIPFFLDASFARDLDMSPALCVFNGTLAIVFFTSIQYPAFNRCLEADSGVLVNHKEDFFTHADSPTKRPAKFLKQGC